MSKQIEEDLDQVLKQILHIGGIVEEAVDKSLRALLSGDLEAGAEVIEGDHVVDDLELEVEEKCLDILALRQPVASDLRLVTAVMKINSDLERIGDLAVNIAERSEVLAAVETLPFRPDVSRMAAVSKRMVKQGLDALVRRDAKLALRVWDMDVEPDRLYREILGEASAFMQTNVNRIGDTLHLLGALRNLERIADHATNIAEDVIYMVEGEIVRHRVEEHRRRQNGHGLPDFRADAAEGTLDA